VQRRAHERHSIWLAVELSQGGGETALAVSRDASKGGVLVLTGVPFEVGAAVRATLRLPPDGAEERTLTAVVVRCEPNREDPDGFWHHRVALRFDAPDEALETWLAELKPPPSFR
jgi:hypothetical protein